MEFETFVIIVVVALIFVFVSVSMGRRNSSRTGQRLCVSCGAGHPPFAQFCRRCGQRLKA